MMLGKILIGIVAGAITVIVPASFASNVAQTGIKAPKKISNNTKQKTILLVKVKITNGRGEVICNPKVTVFDGEKGKIKMVKEVYFPASWKIPASKKTNSPETNFTLPIPVFTNPTELGVTIPITAQIVKHPEKGEIIILYGKVILTKNEKSTKIISPELGLNGFQYSLKSNITGFMLYFFNTNEQKITFQDGSTPYTVKFYVKKLSDLKNKSKTKS